MISIGRIFLAAGLAVSATAATSLRGPVLGYVVDANTQAVRPLNGIPGASHLGAPLDLGFPVARAVFSSAGNFGLVVAAEGDGLYLLDLLEGVPSLTRIPNAIRPDRLALNVTDTAAVLYSSELRRLQVITGLPQNPVAGPLLDLAGLAGSLTALALDSQGREALLALSDGGRGSLVRVSKSGDPRVVALFADPSAVAMINQDRDALVTDAGTNQLFRIRDFAGEAAVEILASERDGVARPVGVEISADGRRIFVANAAERGSVLVLDLDTRAVGLRATPEAPPSRLERLQGRTAFLLNEPGEAPLMVLDNLENPEVYFVPAGRND